jgi:uncharacterized protein YndB with AHSA1/START domain
MSEPLVVTNHITIAAPATAVWDALTNPEKTKVYMFGCKTVSDWTVGSPLLWLGHYESIDVVFVKGIVLEYTPHQRLRYTVIDPNAPMEDIPDNYLNVTYDLAEQNGQTILTVSQDGFEKAADGDKRYQDVYNKGEGWNPVLVEIKKLVESAA